MRKSEIVWHSNADAALFWYRFDLKVMPILSGTKLPVVKWDPWLASLSPEQISRHWRQNPAHEIGFIVGNDIIVFDADNVASIAALTAIEKAFNIAPALVVKTTKGEHHYYRRGKNTYAKSDSHCTNSHPDRIDVKTGRALVILPPSTGKAVVSLEADMASGLTEATQGFIDAVNLHNGRPPRRPSVASLVLNGEPAGDHIQFLRAVVRHVNADRGYDDWLHAGMAIHHETRGSREGFELFDGWSGTGKKYKGAQETEAKWRSFQSDLETAYTIRTLIWMARQDGCSLETICAECEPFDTCGGEDGKS